MRRLTKVEKTKAGESMAEKSRSGKSARVPRVGIALLSNSEMTGLHRLRHRFSWVEFVMPRARCRVFCVECTVIQDNLKIRQRYSTVPRAQERASERVSAAERASEASSAEQVNERADGRVAYY